jgi:hypothetical protein
MVQLSAQGMPVPAIAQVTFTSRDRVRDVLHNFNADGFDTLYPRYRGGRPTTFTLRQRRRIKTLALSRPADHDLPLATWSPGVRIGIVLDNFSPHLSTDDDPRISIWAAANNVELAYTPTNASWLNRIEAQFTALRYFTLDGTDHASHREQASMIRRYLAWRNRTPATSASAGSSNGQTLPDEALENGATPQAALLGLVGRQRGQDRRSRPRTVLRDVVVMRWSPRCCARRFPPFAPAAPIVRSTTHWPGRAGRRQ